MKKFWYFETLKQVESYLKDTNNRDFIQSLYDKLTEELQNPLFMIHHPENRVQYEETAKAYATILGFNYMKCFANRKLA